MVVGVPLMFQIIDVGEAVIFKDCLFNLFAAKMIDIPHKNNKNLLINEQKNYEPTESNLHRR